MSLVKRVRFTSKVNFELRIDVLNVFDNINFNTPFQVGGGNTINQVTSAYTDISNTNDPRRPAGANRVAVELVKTPAYKTESVQGSRFKVQGSRGSGTSWTPFSLYWQPEP
jgi:hypothetical protein